MTQEQILKMENLKVAEVKAGKFVHIHASDGYIITSWNDNDDIKDYTGSICMYMPIRDSYDNDYRTITVEEHNLLTERALEAIKLDERNNL